MTLSVQADVRKVLMPIGWSEERQIDIEEWILELRSRGFEILGNGVLTLRNFGRLEYSNESESNGLPIVDVVFDPRGALVQSLRDWHAQTGVRLFPIGEVDGQANLLVDEDDIWYLSMGGLWKIGDCPNEGLAHLLLGRGGLDD